MDCIFLSASFDSSISLAIRKTWSLNAELISAINIIFDNCDLDGTNLFIQIDSSAEKLRILTAKKGTYDILDVLKKNVKSGILFHRCYGKILHGLLI
jgi:hypothetical protein